MDCLRRACTLHKKREERIKWYCHNIRHSFQFHGKLKSKERKKYEKENYTHKSNFLELSATLGGKDLPILQGGEWLGPQRDGNRLNSSLDFLATQMQTSCFPSCYEVILE